MTDINFNITTKQNPDAGKVITAKGGLPFLDAGTASAGFEAPLPPAPRMADIVVGGKGGGAESGGEFDPDSGGGAE